jgi:dephospho-CoA kinase
MKRDSVSQDQAERLLKSQMPQIEKINRSDFAIENAGTETDLRESGKKLLLELKKQITRD